MPLAWVVPQEPQARRAADNPYAWPLAGANAAFSAWLGMCPAAAAAPPAAWPMAFRMMASGVPRTVAWPAAEANVAVMDAAEVASASVQKVFASYRSSDGHAVSRQPWPPTSMMLMAMLVPLNFGAVLTSLRVA
jgi:hypothetical protein